MHPAKPLKIELHGIDGRLLSLSHGMQLARFMFANAGGLIHRSAGPPSIYQVHAYAYS